MTWESLFVALTIIFSACLARSTFGFGEALIAMPLLTMVLGFQVAAPLIAMLSITVAAGILVYDWRRVPWAGTWRLVLSSLVGIPIGFYFLTSVPETAVNIVLAFVIITFSVYCLTKPDRLKLHSELTSPIFGLMAGILGGAYNTQGPPLVIYATLRQWSAENFRVALQGVFIPTSLVIVLGHVVLGRVTGDVLWLYALSLPLVVIALPLGKWLNRGAVSGHFTGWVHLMLIVIGLSLLANSYWQFKREQSLCDGLHKMSAGTLLSNTENSPGNSDPPIMERANTNPQRGKILTRWMVRLAIACYLVRVLLDLGWKTLLSTPWVRQVARTIWTIGCFFYCLHVLCAFGLVHDWSHQAAWNHTAELTAAVVGIKLGHGLYVNYVFTVFWILDSLGWWLFRADFPYRRRWYFWTLHSVFSFMVFNATVVFGSAGWRFVAVGVCGCLLLVYARKRVFSVA